MSVCDPFWVRFPKGCVCGSDSRVLFLPVDVQLLQLRWPTAIPAAFLPFRLCQRSADYIDAVYTWALCVAPRGLSGRSVSNPSLTRLLQPHSTPRRRIGSVLCSSPSTPRWLPLSVKARIRGWISASCKEVGGLAVSSSAPPKPQPLQARTCSLQPQLRGQYGSGRGRSPGATLVSERL